MTIKDGYEYPAAVRFEIEEQDLASYQRAADFLNMSNADVVCVQHEFGIYGGPAGSHLLALLRELRMPIVTTLHTVLRDPTPDQRRVMQELITRSTRLITMTERGRQMLQETYQTPPAKIDLIPHGIPDMPFVDPNYYNLHFWNSSQTLLQPRFPWEFIQLGNCGSPMETEAGWLVISHGVGAMRKYCIGAFLLDLEDPTKVLGRLREPLIQPNESEREGYVPNVVYSCGSLIHGRRLVIPYAMSDYATTFATLSLDDVLGAME